MKLIKGDCIKNMNIMSPKSIDLIICDLPYGTTQCGWDSIINQDDLFEHYRNILKDNGTIILFGSEPFSSTMRVKALDLYKYDWKWIKSRATGFTYAKSKPMKNYEDIMVFSKGSTHPKFGDKYTYNPQGLEYVNIEQKNSKVKGGKLFGDAMCNVGSGTWEGGSTYIQEHTNYPRMTIEFNSLSERLHPTQKPVDLYEYLIRTYSNPGDVILDNCAGSGTLGAAGLNISDREYIMIELEPEYQEVIINRLPGIEVIEGTDEDVIDIKGEIITLAKLDIGGMEFAQRIKEDFGVDIYIKYLKEFKVKNGARLKMVMGKL